MTARSGAATSTRDRVVAGALRCLASQGLRRTTVDDVAVASGVSRATLYRAFPGGRETILGAVVETELARLLAAIRAATDAEATLEGALVAGMHAAARWLSSHEGLERVMFDEPAALLTHLEFEQMDRTLAVLSAEVAPLLERFLAPGVAERAGEWAGRVCVSYLLFPADDVDLCERGDVARLVARHVLPGVVALAAEGHDETRSTKVS